MQYEDEQYKIGDLVTFIEGETWVFIDKDGIEMKNPPVGIVLEVIDGYSGVKVYWSSSGSICTEWLSQIQPFEEFLEQRRKRRSYGKW